MTREVTTKIIEMAEDGAIGWDDIARAALAYMSEDDVADMARCNDMLPDEDEPDDDGPDETIDVCPDCYYFLVGGMIPDDPSEGWDPDLVAEYVPDCDTWEAIGDEAFFCWRECEACGGLPGNRYTIHGYYIPSRA